MQMHVAKYCRLSLSGMQLLLHVLMCVRVCVCVFACTCHIGFDYTVRHSINKYLSLYISIHCLQYLKAPPLPSDVNRRIHTSTYTYLSRQRLTVVRFIAHLRCVLHFHTHPLHTHAHTHK